MFSLNFHFSIFPSSVSEGCGVLFRREKMSERSELFFPEEKHPVPLASHQNLEGYADAKTGRLCPRSVVHCCTGSFCSGTFTNSRNRLRFSGSSTAVFHSHW